MASFFYGAGMGCQMFTFAPLEIQFQYEIPIVILDHKVKF